MSRSLSLTDSSHSDWFASCSSGLAHLLAKELKELGMLRVQQAGAGVRFSGTLQQGYQACLCSRIANRILLPIHQGLADTPETLYQTVQAIDWSDHINADNTLAVDFFTAQSKITHSQFGALKVKDAIVDQFRQRFGIRPNVDRITPDIRVNVYLYRDKARIAIDFSGTSLHRRGYREEQGLAPLKENLAAALLYAVDWNDAIEQGLALVDPMCGSGTVLTEAALMACRIAPGLSRSYFGFLGWKQHDDLLWQAVKTQALGEIRTSPVAIIGADKDPKVIAQCIENINHAKLGDSILVECADLANGRINAARGFQQGLVLSNPPYGARLGIEGTFYQTLGQHLSEHYAGWQCALFSAQAAPVKQLRLPMKDILSVRNGGIDCVLVKGDIPRQSASALHSNESTEIDVQAFRNRIKKNQRALKGWLKQNRVMAYRLYDADLPDFAVAIDIYHGTHCHCVVQEYRAPETVNIAVAKARLDAALSVIRQELHLDHDQLHVKVREIQSGLSQYQKNDAVVVVDEIVSEFGGQLEVNFTDYLDTGLFLDHRPVRRYLFQHSEGKRFLNLFSYTGAATVAALTGGASATVSVDSSNRYCQWAQRNLDRNGAAREKHQIVKQDVISWLNDTLQNASETTRFDLMLLDPPTFSNSSGREDDWSVQNDHPHVIRQCLQLLEPGGLLIFSTNFRQFKLSKEIESLNEQYNVENRSRWSIDRDFQRNSRIHQCWFIWKE